MKSRGWFKIRLGHEWGIRLIREIGMISPTQIISVGIKGISRSQVVIDIIDLLTIVFGQWTPSLAIHSQIFSRTTNFT